MPKLTIASLEREGPTQPGYSDSFKIVTTTNKICYASVGQWNGDWRVGMTVEADVETKRAKNGKAYFKLHCPPHLNSFSRQETRVRTGAVHQNPLLTGAPAIIKLLTEIRDLLSSHAIALPAPSVETEISPSEDVPQESFPDSDVPPFSDDIPPPDSLF